jgi:hypothetical protein
MQGETSRAGLRLAAERLVTVGARAAWPLVKRVSRRFARTPPQPAWAPSPLIRSSGSTRPPVGWPRQTDSLCPECVQRVRRDVLSGRLSLTELVRGSHAQIKADIIERDGRVLMVKECPEHGVFEDVLSIDPAFLARMERLFPGRDFEARAHGLRDHGASSIKYGRGSVLTVDLTNRCNMKCAQCFMDANQPGTAMDLNWAEIQQTLDDCLEVEPRRQMSVQFSGGEPTLSPHFLDAIRYARKLGYFCVQCASNGLRFARDPEYCRLAKDAGLRLCYLQFDGVTNDQSGHRGIHNLFDVHKQAIDNLHAAGVDVVLVPTIVNGVNSDQVGKIVDFAIENADKINVVSFQPVSFSGRCEDISDERRRSERYTLSHLVHDVHDQTGLTEPLRDWFPLGAMNPFSDLADLLLGPDSPFGALKCGCHPHCGVGTILLVHKRTRQMVPVSAFVDLERLLADVQVVVDSGHGRSATVAALAVAVLRNVRVDRLPNGYGLTPLVRQLLSQIGASGNRIGDTEGDSKDFEWRLLFIAGMWFQDLFTYDFRRTEMCIIPYGTRLGEISFCAYNTGIGWRHFLERLGRPTQTDTRALYGGGAERNEPAVFSTCEGLPNRSLPGPNRTRRRLPVVR